MAETPERKTVLCWYFKRQNEHGYWKLYLFAFAAAAVPVEELIRGAATRTMWNKEDVASRMEAFYQKVQSAGHAVVYESSSFTDKLLFRINWQEYDSDDRTKGYTRHEISQLGDGRFDQALESIEFVGELLDRVERLFPRMAGAYPSKDFTTLVGRYASFEEADTISAQLRAFGFDARSIVTSTKEAVVTIGRYPTRDAAEEATSFLVRSISSIPGIDKDKLRGMDVEKGYRIRRDQELEDPMLLVRMLERMPGAVRVARFDTLSQHPLTYVAAKEPRSRLRSEGILSMFDG